MKPVKTRTFTVLITEDYEFDQPTDEDAIGELRDALQTSFDQGLLIGQNFLITKVEQGDIDFWKAWRAAADQGLDVEARAADYESARPDGPETARGGLIGQQPY